MQGLHTLVGFASSPLKGAAELNLAALPAQASLTASEQRVHGQMVETLMNTAPAAGESVRPAPWSWWAWSVLPASPGGEGGFEGIGLKAGELRSPWTRP